MADTSSTPVDAADKGAGGEVIYSSEGLEPIRPPELPTPSKAGEDVLSTTGISTADAYRVFTSTSSKETPNERLTRLTRELHELEAETSQESLLTQVQALQKRLLSCNTSGAENATNSSPSAAASSETDIAVRLQRLETLANESVASRLSTLEQQVTSLDSLETLSKKAKIIRQDLEAASKARHKLQQNKDDAVAIQKLHQQLESLHDIAPQLPVLIQRLQALAHVHQQATSHQARLSQAETNLTHGMTILSQLQQALTQLETQWNQQAPALEQTLKELQK